MTAARALHVVESGARPAHARRPATEAPEREEAPVAEAGPVALGGWSFSDVPVAPPDDGDGRPLDPGLRAFFEPRLGASLARVRVHAGARAAAAARRERARAFTVGGDVVFGAGQYAPETARGRWLLAHELAHVAQAARSEGDAADTAVERDASDAATAALTGKVVRLRARRSAAHVHRFGEPDHPPDLTFVSTSGEQGFLNQATAFHRTWGLNPRRFDSMQGLLATLAGSTGTISRLRIVTHANFDNLFTPLFDNGSAGITEDDLLAWAESDAAGIRRALGTPLLPDALRGQVLTAARGANTAVFQGFGVDPANPPTTGPLARLLEASADLLAVRTATGAIPQAQRTALTNALTAELTGLRAQVQQQQAAAATGTGGTPPQAQDLQDAITNVTGFNFQLPAQDPGFIAGVRTATAGAASSFRANLNAVRGRLTAASWIDIRGCRVGQRPAYLTAVRRFFGTATAQPNVSGPDWWQSFPTLGAQNVDDRGITVRAADADVQAALLHWSEVTGVHERLMWWLRLLSGVLRDESRRLAAELERSPLTPPSLRGGLRLELDPLLELGGMPLPLPPLPEPTLARPQRPGPFSQTLRNPLVEVARRDIPRYTAPDGELRYYLDSGLPLQVQRAADVENIFLLLKAGREREAMNAWLASEWAPAAPGLAALQTGSWTAGPARQVEAVSDLDEQRRPLAMYVSPDPRYAEHIRTTA